MTNPALPFAASLLCLTAWGCPAPAGDPPVERTTGDPMAEGGSTVEASIHPSLPEFSFTLRGEPVDATRGTYRVTGIEVRHGTAAAPLQTIEGVETETPVSDDVPGLEVLDMNFDGYGDLRVMQFAPAGPNVAYLNWLFDPNSGRFVRATGLDAIASPVFDRETRRIRSDWRDGATRYGTHLYEVVENEPVLVRKELREYSEPGVYRWTVLERRDGGWTTVEDKVVRE